MAPDVHGLEGIWVRARRLSRDVDIACMIVGVAIGLVVGIIVDFVVFGIGVPSPTA